MFTSQESFDFVGYDKLTYETEDLVSRTLTGVSHRSTRQEKKRKQIKTYSNHSPR